ncbi:MAG: DUF4915 domain-containing protein [Microcoleus sp.]
MSSDSMNNDRTNFNTVHEHEIFGDRDLPSWLTEQQISLACTTYQTSRLMLIGAVPETNRIVDKNNQILFISTLFNCIATLSDRHSCKPLWKPPFISRYINEDRDRSLVAV